METAKLWSVDFSMPKVVSHSKGLVRHNLSWMKNGHQQVPLPNFLLNDQLLKGNLHTKTSVQLDFNFYAVSEIFLPYLARNTAVLALHSNKLTGICSHPSYARATFSIWVCLYFCIHFQGEFYFCFKVHEELLAQSRGNEQERQAGMTKGQRESNGSISCMALGCITHMTQQLGFSVTWF